MTTFDNNNRGVLFANDRKTKPNQPDFTGNIVIGQDLIVHMTREIAAGREPKIALSGWNKTSAAGKRFLSLAADKPFDKNAQGGGGYAKASPTTGPSQYDDDVPF